MDSLPGALRTNAPHHAQVDMRRMPPVPIATAWVLGIVEAVTTFRGFAEPRPPLRRRFAVKMIGNCCACRANHAVGLMA